MVMSTDSSKILEQTSNISVSNGFSLLEEKHHAYLSPLSETERQQMAIWNATEFMYSRDTCVPQLIARQAAATPDAVALIDGDQRLSYREMNQRANQLAHMLQGLGVRPDVLVGVCLERSLDLVVGLLGILKAGGAYVPLDPAYPPERLAFMLEDARADVLVTRKPLAASLPTE